MGWINDSKSGGTDGPGWKPRSVAELAGDLERTHPYYRLALDESVSQGGMGAVYYGVDTRTGRDIALKLLPHEKRDEPGYQQRFKREVEILRELNGHPNIVPYIDAGETADGDQFLVMARLKGQTLAEVLGSSGLLPVARVVKIMHDICAGVEHAHTHIKKFVHRDLKAANVFIQETDGRAVLLDFGLAREVSLKHGTWTGKNLAGTPGHIAPELRQPWPGTPTPASDVFSLGVILYQMLTRQPPPDIGYRAPSELGMDRKFDAVVKKALSQHPEDRYRSAAEFAAALRTAASGGQEKMAEPATAGYEARKAAVTPELRREPRPERSLYAAGTFDLPFAGVKIKILHDQVTAIVAGVQGKIAAVDLRTGRVIATAEAEDSTGRDSRPGGGENMYVADTYFFLELASAPQCFYTMSHSAVFKTWVFDGGFRLISSVPLIRRHFEELHASIMEAGRGSGRSSWTVYDRPVPEDVPGGIVDAKLSPDRSSVICLTDWFAIFRCDLSGRLRDKPMVVGDAFSIEPANPDGSEVWAGLSQSYRGDTMVRMGFPGKLAQGYGSTEARSICSAGIHALSPDTILAGSLPVALPSLSRITTSEFGMYPAHRPVMLQQEQRVLAASLGRIDVYEAGTLKRLAEESLVAGHEGEVRAIDATKDGRYLVSISARSVRVWDFKNRIPVGGYPASETFLHHGLQTSLSPSMQMDDGKVYTPGVNGSSLIIDMRQRAVTRVKTPVVVVGVAADDLGQGMHVLSLIEREGLPERGMKGMLANFLKKPLPVEYFLCHHQVLSGQFTERATVPLELIKSNNSWVRWVHPLQESIGVDLGSGRLAVLAASHLVIYNTSTNAVICGPVFISEMKEDSESWVCYTQLAASPDRMKLFARGSGQRIKMFNALNLVAEGEISGSEGQELGLLIPWSDSRHVLFSTRGKAGRSDYGTPVALWMADSMTGKVVRKICDLTSSPSPNPGVALLLAGGTALALADGDKVWLIDLVTGQHMPEPVAVHAGTILSIHKVSADDNEIMTLSADGSARFWRLQFVPGRESFAPAVLKQDEAATP